ncbi:MAG: dNTP triphosphohydrolase [Planctomycetales bacterium]|nr:dNTP triphosphohydrolase [Planctomycetales bacterium]
MKQTTSPPPGLHAERSPTDAAPPACDAREEALLAPYAMSSAASLGRVHAEPGHAYRNPFQRDRDRIVHSSAFRRLAHKTQVFIGDMGDYHRTRLTHTLEVASIARTIGRTLRLNEDLIEPLALAHDLGHPPFGHAGEDILDECLGDEGGFNHNQQALRIVELLETRYPEFPGLNLTLELLSGQRARACKVSDPASGDDPRPAGVLLEVQAVDAADSIAYDAHDADDAVELGLLSLGELEKSELWRQAGDRARRRYAALDDADFRRATVHEIIDRLVGDLLAATSKRLQAYQFGSPQEAIECAETLVGPSDEVRQIKRELERLLFERVYRHPDVLAQRGRAGEALRGVFNQTLERAADLPEPFCLIARADSAARAVGDYLACMTDRCALETFAKMPIS